MPENLPSLMLRACIHVPRSRCRNAGYDDHRLRILAGIPLKISGIPVSLIILGVFALFILGNIAVFNAGISSPPGQRSPSFHLAKIATKIDVVIRAFQVMGKHQSVLWISLAISFVNQLLVISVTWITAVALS